MPARMMTIDERPGLRRCNVIAEMACSHDGSATLARTIIDGAGQAGADAIQFQVWTLRDMVVPHHPDYPRLQGLELSRRDWTDLAAHVRERHPRMQIVACVYERGSVDFCEGLGVDAYKVHSSDLSNPPLLRYLASTRKRIDLSVGASSLDEIQAAIDLVRGASSAPLWLMYGLQTFPTPPEAVRLAYLAKLGQLFELPVGYQDHSDPDTDAAFTLPAAALGMGVGVLEKHITHDRSRKGADHEAALNPDEFVRFVRMVREVEAARGSATPRSFSEAETRYRTYSKKSIVAARDLPAGTRIAEGDLAFMRADVLGLPPDQAGRLLGRFTRSAIAAYQVVLEADVT